MNELTAVKRTIDEIGKIEHVANAALISRGGMFITGTSPKGAHRETFSAMAAIIMGAGETTSTELRDELNKMTLELGEQMVFLIGVGSGYMLAVVTDRQGDGDRLVAEARGLMDKVELLG